MEYEKTVAEIAKSLTNDLTENFCFLKAELAKYRNDAQQTAICRAILAMMADIIPSQHQQIVTLFDKAIDETGLCCELGSYLIGRGDYEKARYLLKRGVDLIGSDRWANGRTFSFKTPVEEILYLVENGMDEELQAAPGNYSRVLQLYAYTLAEKGDFTGSEAALEEALRWNPMSAEIMLEVAEIARRKEEYDRFYELSKRALETACSSEEVATCYRNLGYYFLTKHDYETAQALYLVSLSFAKNETATAELYYTISTGGLCAGPIPPAQLRATLSKKGIQLGANPTILSIAMDLGARAQKQGSYRFARSCYEMVYRLTDDPEIGVLIARLPGDRSAIRGSQNAENGIIN